MRKKNYIFLVWLIAGIFLPFFGMATHLRAGEITAKRISSTTLTYRVTLTTYTDEINGKAANDSEEEVSFYFGYSTSQVVAIKVKRRIKQLISPSTVRNVYDTTFTFPAPGRYTISCGIINRNERTLNLPQPSENISFFVQTTLVINASFGLNSTPVLLNIPVDSAGVGRRFIHNPGAFDIDGDSLAYRLTIPQKDRGNATGVGEFIANYRDPNQVGNSPILNEAGSGPATFRIDARTGDLIWDAPQVPGQYNVAFIIEEWRKAPDGSYIRIGEIVRDMQIIVVATDNKRPELVVPPDICVEAGKQVKFDVEGKDVDNQDLRLTSSGGVYNLDEAGRFFQFVAPEAATFTTKQSKSPVSGSFSWNTNCLHVRDQPYDVLFKVEDFPGRFSTQLVDIKTIRIKVLPPRPLGLVAAESEEGIGLSWQKYSGCSATGEILIYRKDGCSGLNPGECSQGVPGSWGYRLIATVSNTDTVYLDRTVTKGAVYSYRLVSRLQASQFITVLSAPSTEYCIGSEVKPGMSVITNVSVDKTDAAAGEVTVKWSRPLNFDAQSFPGPYQYKLYRATGLGGEQYELIHTQNTLLDAKADTVFTDKGLNTKEISYRYKVEFYIESAELFGTTPPATTVRLTAAPDDRLVRLSWEANVPWLNDNRVHNIYREDKSNPGVYNRIAAYSVSTPNTFNYNDTGRDIFTGDGDISIELQNGQNYCYKVETAGVYDKIPGLGILMNYSQIVCATPADRSPPCPPVLSVGATDCETLKPEQFCNEQTFSNILQWQTPATVSGAECRRDIVSYRIYYARHEGQRFGLIETLDASLGTRYIHRKNRTDGFAGCYYVTSVSSLGVESPASNTICVDNCENISFPNVFSPNGDHLNDTFSPMNCPAFVKNISYEIFNANTGVKVASGSGPEMAWDGKNSSGQPLAAGVYHYLIKVKFERLQEDSPEVTYKGWVKLMR